MNNMPTLWNDKNRWRWLVFGIGVLAALSVVLKLVPMTWRLFGYYPEIKPALTPKATSSVTLVPLDTQPIMDLAPFGESPGRAGPLSASAQGNLQLFGVSLASPATMSSALIASGGAEAQSYLVGAAIPGGGVLEAVNADGVVLKIDGRSQILSFPQASLPTSNAVTILSGGPAAAGSSPTAASGSARASASPPSTRQPQINASDTINIYREKLRDNPLKLADELGAEPSAQGYRLGGKLSSELRRAGLRPGDVVLSINGKPAGDLNKDRLQFEDVAASGRARIVIQRADRTLTLSYPLR